MRTPKSPTNWVEIKCLGPLNSFIILLCQWQECSQAVFKTSNVGVLKIVGRKFFDKFGIICVFEVKSEHTSVAAIVVRRKCGASSLVPATPSVAFRTFLATGATYTLQCARCAVLQGRFCFSHHTIKSLCIREPSHIFCVRFNQNR